MILVSAAKALYIRRQKRKKTKTSENHAQQQIYLRLWQS